MQAQNAEQQQVAFFAKSSSPNEWKTIVTCIQTMVEDATFEISPDGLSFRGMDPSHVALVDVFWPSSGFERYECNKPDKFTVRIEDYAKLIKRSDSKDAVEVSREAGDSLKINIGNESYKRSFELHLLDSSIKSSPLPKLSFDSRFVMAHASFSQAINDISTVSNHVTIRTNNDVISFSGKGDIGKAQANLEKGSGGVFEVETKAGSSDEGSSATYNIEYLLKIVKSIGAATSDTIKVEYSSKMPLRMEFGLGDSASKGGRIHFYLAPRVGSASE